MDHPLNTGTPPSRGAAAEPQSALFRRAAGDRRAGRRNRRAGRHDLPPVVDTVESRVGHAGHFDRGKAALRLEKAGIVSGGIHTRPDDLALVVEYRQDSQRVSNRIDPQEPSATKALPSLHGYVAWSGGYSSSVTIWRLIPTSELRRIFDSLSNDVGG